MLLILAALIVVVSLCLFALTQDFTLPMTLFDNYSAIFIVLGIVDAVCTIGLFVSIYFDGKYRQKQEFEFEVVPISNTK